MTPTRRRSPTRHLPCLKAHRAVPSPLRARRLEERLGYTHKGIEQRMTQMPPLQAHRLAGRVSGDSTVAYAWAYCMALESAWACEIPQRAQWLHDWPTDGRKREILESQPSSAPNGHR